MRLHPEVSPSEALAWLQTQANALELSTMPDDLEEALIATADAMSIISRTVLPDDLEPLFP
ncbi:MAG: hypothetical protein ACKVVP_23650 [Chloroflexota bacterium]